MAEYYKAGMNPSHGAGSSLHPYSGLTHDEDTIYYSDSANVQCDSGVCLTFRSTPSLSSDSIRPNDQATPTENAGERLAENFQQLNLEPTEDGEDDGQSDFVVRSLVQERPIAVPENSDIFDQDEEGDTRLHLAIVEQDVDAALSLIRAAAADCPEYFSVRNDRYLQTPLHLAILTDQPAVVRALVIHGASPMVRDRRGDTSVHLACARALLPCLTALTAPLCAEERAEAYAAGVRGSAGVAGAMQQLDMAATTYEGESCLHLAQASKSPARIQVLDYLLWTCEADVNMREGKSGFTVLHRAVVSKDSEVVRLLLRRSQLDVNARSYGGATALALARSVGGLEDVERALRQRGAVEPPVAYEVVAEMELSSSDSEEEHIHTIPMNALAAAGFPPVDSTFYSADKQEKRAKKRKTTLVT